MDSLSKLPGLEILELRGNQLESTNGIDAYSLQELYLVRIHHMLIIIKLGKYNNDKAGK